MSDGSALPSGVTFFPGNRTMKLQTSNIVNIGVKALKYEVSMPRRTGYSSLNGFNVQLIDQCSLALLTLTG